MSEPWSRWKWIRFHLRSIRIHMAGCFRALWRGAPRQPPALPVEGVHHPSELCKCDCGSGGEPKDHDPTCIWLAKMCRHCSGEGWCPECFGDGCAAERGQT